MAEAVSSNRSAGDPFVGKQVVREDRMQVQDRVPIEGDVRSAADEKLDRRLVVENHLRVEVAPAIRLLAELNQPPGLGQ